MDTKKLRQKILDLAIRGKLVPQDPNDEPASVLLERIRAEKERLIKEGKIKRSKKVAADDEIEAPFEISESWEWVRLDDICSIKGGKRIPRGKNFSKIPTKHVYLRVTNMKSHTIIENEIKYIDEEVFQTIKNYTINSNDLYLTIAGTIGDVGTIPPKFDDMNLTENAAKLTNIICSKSFLMYALLSDIAQEHFSSRFHQVAQPKLSIETASSTIIPLPPLAEQKRIANEVERWFTLIDELESNEGDLLKAIDKTKSKILDLAIHGKLVPQDPNDESALQILKFIREEKVQLVKKGELKKTDLKDVPIFEDEKPFDIPYSWEWCRMLSLTTLITKGTTPRGGNVAYLDSGIGFLRAENIDGIDKLNLKYLKYIDNETNNGYLKRSKLKENDILITIAGSLGRTAIVRKEDLPLNANQAICLCRFVDIRVIDLLYVLFALNAPVIQAHLLKSSKVTAIPNLTLEIISETIIPLPPLAEQKRIVAKIEEFFAVLDGIKESLE